MSALQSFSDDIAQLYKQLANQISAEDEAEVRRLYKELLGCGEPSGAILGFVMSSVYKVQNHEQSGGPEPADNELLEAPPVPVLLQQRVSEVPARRPHGADLYSDRSEPAPIGVTVLCGADVDDRPLHVPSALKRAQWEPGRATPGAGPPEPAAADRAGDLDTHDDPVADTANDPALVSPVGVGHSSRPGSGHQLRARLATQRAQAGLTKIALEAEAPEPETLDGLSAPGTHDKIRTATAGNLLLVSPVGQSPRPGSRRPRIALIAAVAITILTAAIFAAVSIRFLPRWHQPAAEDHAAAPQSAIISPPTPAVWAIVAEVSRVALEPTTVVLAALNEEKRLAVADAAPTEKSADVTPPAIVPIEAPAFPAEKSASLQYGGALHAKGDVTSARLLYERASTAGDGMVALRFGASYDPRFLATAGFNGVQGDQALAARWDLRAQEPGASVANVLKSTEEGND